MQLRTLGRSGLKVAPLCFGGNIFGWTADERRSFELLDALVDLGFNFIDTADVYSRWVAGHQGGESEAIIGNWMKSRGSRTRVILATKVGMEMQAGKGLSKAHILASVEASLRRLQTDYIDLYQSHVADPETPIAETLSTFAELISAGKVRAIGASNYTGPQLSEALRASERLGLPRYESLQPEFNLYTVEPYQTGLEPVCRGEDIGVIPYYALAGGFLTGKYRSEEDYGKSARGPTMKRYLNDRGKRILSALDAVAKDLNATPGQVALAWLIARPSVTAPIVSATSRAQLDEIAKSVLLKLDDNQIGRLNAASAS